MTIFGIDSMTSRTYQEYEKRASGDDSDPMESGFGFIDFIDENPIVDQQPDDTIACLENLTPGRIFKREQVYTPNINSQMITIFAFSIIAVSCLYFFSDEQYSYVGKGLRGK